ncbi:FAD-dependent oxidoreductase [Planosporangium flavigriseum]|uniref:FAD-dependent oxidoreductase n=1 Tax=Planosporangium flavigriseum TaxID=373681 RepID=A0A8J3LWH2_9ACTN|nr:FAD-dependent oxidoreductase [Planosporangium flavigriseum]NJC66051.1 FAD-dependent oxidoreductase [Planosporangium flavigriseum]GIG75084.1 FAD-dependent oxidoreductase [Planosporangium flavigriseum]
MSLPERSRIVIIGGGVVGCSIAYHLAQRGVTDVTLVERRKLTDGSTWHAAGLVGQLRSSSSLTQLMQKSVETYQTLEEKTGYATGWRGVGSIRVASSPDRWEEIRRLATTGKSFGFDVHLVSPKEALDLFPLLNTDGVYGATWIPSDGYVDPSQLTHSFATGARAAGVKIIQDCRVESIERVGRRITAVVTSQGRIECDTLVNATGMWGTETARLAGVDLAVNAVEHQYVVTEKADGIPWDLPTMRDPDARFYLKPEAGGLVIGGWEEGTRAPWRRIPVDLGPDLFPPNYERFEGLADGAAHRIPRFGELGIQTWVNGPIPFSPDAEPLMGITEDLDNMFHCCGFSAGVAAGGGAGWAMANWIVDGDPGLDLWPFDVRRFGRPHNVPAYLEKRSIEAYGTYYQISYPNRELEKPRGQRTSALYGALRERGAVFGTKFGWERANWFAPEGQERVETPTFGRSNAFPYIAAEHEAVRTAVGVVDQSSFSKYEIFGPGALALLQKVAGANMDVKIGKIVYTQLLNPNGGIEADVTITRLAEDEFYFVTGSGFGRHDLTFLLQHAPDDGSVYIRDVTSAYGVLNVCGPRARDVAAKLTWASLSNEAFPYMTAQHIDLGHAPVRALRATYVGELGWEFHVPTEYMLDLYERILSAGAEFGIRNVGYKAVESLRLEKQYLAWATDIKSDTNPYEAGLGFAVKPDKPELLAGPVLRQVREDGITQQLCWFSADPEAVMHGGELLTHANRPLAATVKSAGYGHTVGRTIFSAYVPIELADETDFIVDVATERFPARRENGPMYDPKGTRIRA